MDEKLKTDASADCGQPETDSVEKIESEQDEKPSCSSRCPDHYCFEVGM